MTDESSDAAIGLLMRDDPAQGFDWYAYPADDSDRERLSLSRVLAALADAPHAAVKAVEAHIDALDSSAVAAAALHAATTNKPKPIDPSSEVGKRLAAAAAGLSTACHEYGMAVYETGRQPTPKAARVVGAATMFSILFRSFTGEFKRPPVPDDADLDDDVLIGTLEFRFNNVDRVIEGGHWYVVDEAAGKHRPVHLHNFLPNLAPEQKSDVLGMHLRVVGTVGQAAQEMLVVPEGLAQPSEYEAAANAVDALLYAWLRSVWSDGIEADEDTARVLVPAATVSYACRMISRGEREKILP